MSKATEADWAAWMGVLENPESRKAQNTLERYGEDPPRCCLGHLCAISPEVERVVPLKEEEGKVAGEVTCLYRSINPPGNLEHMKLPGVLAQKFDLTPEGEFNRLYSDKEIAEIVGVDSELFWEHNYENLTELNDSSDLSLAQIATFIRHLKDNADFKTWREWEG